jgi:hypothetical protein
LTGRKEHAKPKPYQGIRATQLRVVDSRRFEHMEAPWRKYEESYTASTEKKAKDLATIHEDTMEEGQVEKDESQIKELDSSKEKKELEAVERGTHSQAYWKEMDEIKNKLPKEVKEFADVFCSED